ncbi:MAG: hypothetical protein ACREF5_02705 [Candidatus Saccharimonadales bacterium]
MAELAPHIEYPLYQILIPEGNKNTLRENWVNRWVAGRLIATLMLEAELGNNVEESAEIIRPITTEEQSEIEAIADSWRDV